MELSNSSIVLTEDDLKKIFSLFSSTTKFEKGQVYDEHSSLYFRHVRLLDEYSLMKKSERSR